MKHQHIALRTCQLQSELITIDFVICSFGLQERSNYCPMSHDKCVWICFILINMFNSLFFLFSLIDHTTLFDAPFCCSGLEMAPYCGDAVMTSAVTTYDLYAVIKHKRLRMDLAHYTAIARRPCTSDTQNSVLGKVEGASGNCSMPCVFVCLFSCLWVYLGLNITSHLNIRISKPKRF